VDDPTEPAPVAMLQGVVAMIDALGFKGIWKDPEDPSTGVLESLRRIGDGAHKDRWEAAERLKHSRLPDEVVKFVKNPQVKIVQLSDTIVVAAGREPRERAVWARHAAELEKAGYDIPGLEKAVDGFLRYLVCRCVSRILLTAALCDPPLTYRGVVTFGRFAIDENFLLGPAVDEAADLMDLADGPFVWLAPTSLWLPHRLTERKAPRWNTVAVPYSVPLKEGRTIRTRVVNPFAYSANPGQRQRIEGNILGALVSPKIDVFVKRDNTQQFFERVAVMERIAARAAARRQEQAREEGVRAYVAAVLPAGEPPTTVAPAQPAPPAAMDKPKIPARPGHPPTEPAE
jgi:hypothetical protein